MNRLQQFIQLSGRKALRKGIVSPILSVPKHIERPPYITPGITLQQGSAELSEDEPVPILTLQEQELLRKSGSLAAQILSFAVSLVKV